MNIIKIAVAACLLALLAGCKVSGSTAGKPASVAISGPSIGSASSPVVVPTSYAPQTFEASVPSPNPDGKYTGACDYTLSTNFSYAHAGRFIGQVRVHNTGNIGIRATVRMQWAQLGYAPVRVTKKTRVRFGAAKTVRFHANATSDEIDRYQSVDLQRAGSACHYKATITGTFGSAHG